MRILFITNLYPPYHIGGYEIACKDIAEGFRRRGHIVRVLTSIYGVDKPVMNDDAARLLDITLKLNSRQSLFEKSSSLYFNSTNYSITKSYIEDFAPDIVSFWSVNGISASTIFAAEKKGISKVFHLFDRSLSYLRKTGIKGVSNYLFFNRLNVKHLISSSSELKKDYVSRGFAEANIAVIPHGISIKEFAFKEKKTNRALRLLYVGQLWEAKGVSVLLKAAGLLKKENVDFILTIIGKGEQSYVRFLHDVCKKENVADDVQFLGRVERQDLVNYYQENHVLVFPSIWKEPFGIVLLEAMATGTPTITSKCGGPLDIVKDGRTGFFFESGDYKALASKILLFERSRNIISEMGHTARQTVLERFDIKIVVNQIESLYSRIVN